MCNMQSSWPGGFAQRSDLIDFFVWCLILYIWKSGCFFKEDVCLNCIVHTPRKQWKWVLNFAILVCIFVWLVWCRFFLYLFVCFEWKKKKHKPNMTLRAHKEQPDMIVIWITFPQLSFEYCFHHSFDTF